MKKIDLPASDVPMVIAGGVVNPIWYEKLTALAKAVNGGILGAIDFDNSSPIANGQVPVWDNTAKKFKGGAN